MTEEERSEAAEKEEEEDPERTFTTKRRAEGLAPLNKLLTHFEGRTQTSNNLQGWNRWHAMHFVRIKRLTRRRRKTIQTKLTMFMNGRKETPPATLSAAPADDIDDPQPSTSGQWGFVCFATKILYIFCTCILCVG